MIRRWIEEVGSTFVGALFQLAVMRSLLDEIEEGLGEGFVGEGPCYIVFLVSLSARFVRYDIVLCETYRHWLGRTWWVKWLFRWSKGSLPLSAAVSLTGLGNIK